MGRYCTDKDINKQIKVLMKKGWGCYQGRKHNKLVSPNGSLVTVSVTPSDFRAFKNFMRDIAKAV